MGILVRARTETRIFVRSVRAGVFGGPDRGCEPGLGGRVGVSVLFGAQAGSHVGGLLWPNAEPFTAEVDVLAVPRRSGGSGGAGGGAGEAAGGREASEAWFAAMWTVRAGEGVFVGDSATHARALAVLCCLATARWWAPVRTAQRRVRSSSHGALFRIVDHLEGQGARWRGEGRLSLSRRFTVSGNCLPIARG